VKPAAFDVDIDETGKTVGLFQPHEPPK
jgi:hypothetical protein